MQCSIAQLIKVGIKWDFKQTEFFYTVIQCLRLGWWQCKYTGDNRWQWLPGSSCLVVRQCPSRTTARTALTWTQKLQPTPREDAPGPSLGTARRARPSVSAPRPRAARVSCVSATFLVSPPRCCRRGVRGSGRARGSLASILSSFSSSLPTNKSMTRILSKLVDD